MRVLIATVKVPFVRGGAEILADELCAALRREGHEADIAAIPFKWYPPARIGEHALACRLLDLTEVEGAPIDRLIGLKFPAYLVPHPEKSLWLLHQHRGAYDLWADPAFGDLVNFPDGRDVKELIARLDERFIPDARAVYTISENVSRRLRMYSGIESTPLYHPPQDPGRFRSEAGEPYLFFPSRINALKRQELVLEALATCRQPVVVRFAGRAERPAYLDALRSRAVRLGVDPRVTWEGGVSAEELATLYARCRGVVYPPVDEDYGYVTLEAMLSGKAVVTCRDSGGALEFVDAGTTGIVADPSAASLGEAMDELWADPSRAAKMGQSGRGAYEARGISWTRVVEALLS